MPGGMYEHGAAQEDGPATWEALVSPRGEPVHRDPETNPGGAIVPTTARVRDRMCAAAKRTKRSP